MEVHGVFLVVYRSYKNCVGQSFAFRKENVKKLRKTPVIVLKYHERFARAALVATVFPTQLTGAFAAYHTSKATAFTLTFVLARFLCLRERIYFILAFSALGLCGYTSVEVMIAKHRTKEKTIVVELADTRASEKSPLRKRNSDSQSLNKNNI